MSEALALYEALIEETGTIAAARAALRVLDGIPGVPKLRTIDRDLARQQLPELLAKRPIASVRWLAQRLGMPRSTVYGWLKKSSVPPLNPDGGIRIESRIEAGGSSTKAVEPATPIQTAEGKRSLKKPRRSGLRRKPGSYRGAPTSSPYVGVSRESETRWRAYVRMRGTFIFRRLYKTEAEAAVAAKRARQAYLRSKFEKAA